MAAETHVPTQQEYLLLLVCPHIGPKGDNRQMDEDKLTQLEAAAIQDLPQGVGTNRLRLFELPGSTFLGPFLSFKHQENIPHRSHNGFALKIRWRQLKLHAKDVRYEWKLT